MQLEFSKDELLVICKSLHKTYSDRKDASSPEVIMGLDLFKRLVGTYQGMLRSENFTNFLGNLT